MRRHAGRGHGGLGAAALVASIAAAAGCGSLLQAPCAPGFVDDGVTCQPAGPGAEAPPSGAAGGGDGASTSGETGGLTTSSSTSSAGGAGGAAPTGGGGAGGDGSPPIGGGHVLGGATHVVKPGGAGALPAPCTTAESAVIGMDFSGVTPGSPEARLLGNAVFRTAAEPVRILDYRELAEWNASSVTNVVDLVASEALARGRTVKTTVAHDAADAREKLGTDAYDLFFVHDLPDAAPGVLAALGASFHDAIDAFGHGCRTIVVLATAQGAGEMGAFLTAAGVLEVPAVAPATSEGLVLAAPGDPLASGVALPFLESQTLAGLQLGHPDGIRTTVITTAGGAAVAVRRTW